MIYVHEDYHNETKRRQAEAAEALEPGVEEFIDETNPDVHGHYASIYQQ